MLPSLSLIEKLYLYLQKSKLFVENVACVEVIVFQGRFNALAEISDHHNDPFHLFTVMLSVDIFINDSK